MPSLPLLIAVLALLLPASAVAAPASPPVPHDPVMQPTGQARGVVLTIHGGAWVATGPGALAHIRPKSVAFAQAGWIVHNIDYRPGAGSLPDVVAAVRWAKARYPNHPLCLFGESAGGHLALVAAARVRGVDCVIAHGAPTDLTSWRAPHARNSGLAAATTGYFGRAGVRRTANPLWLARHGRLNQTRTLIQHEAQDPIVEFSHARRFCAAAPRCTLTKIRPGATIFVHSFGHTADLSRAGQRAGRLLHSVARSQGW